MTVSCPVCSTLIAATEAHIGMKNRCVECRSKFIVPASQDEQIVILELGSAPRHNGPRPLTFGKVLEHSLEATPSVPPLRSEVRRPQLSPPPIPTPDRSGDRPEAY